ncbi:MAG: ATP-dependent zinc metalloprotease FtsH [Clostridia bacterium]|nr:ATP-dependent zinc metalloprotease FtsH [Clostridia bacterium]
MGYIIVLGTFLLISILLSGSLTGPKDRTVTYPKLLEMIQKDEVAAVAIRNTSLVGLRKDTKVADADFPDRDYDFETTIGDDFIETVRQMEATKQGVSLDTVSVSDLPFTVQYRAPVTIPWWYDFIPLLLMMVLLGGLWFVMLRSQGGGGGGKVMSFGKSRARMAEPGKNKVTFADVAGADEEKEELQEMVDFLRNPRTYIDMGARIPKGVLLVGPPGTGKTLLAKAVAGEAGVPFFSISGSDFVEMFVGVGASRVRDLFDQAKRSAPSIVFIDEIDAVGRHRGAGLGGGHDEREQTLNQLLVEMDGFAANEGVIVMAATNRRDILDPALLRPGRFDRTITVNYPDLEGRVAILKVHTKGKPLAADVDLVNIAKRTPFATGAELENMMNEAAILAARSRKKEIDHQLMVDAIARVQMGPEKRSHKVTDRDRRNTAIHEVGHAMVAHMLPQCEEVHLITIVPRGKAAGHTLTLPEQEYDNLTRSQLLDRIAMMLGGRAAEEVVLGEFETGAVSDLQRATDLCRRMVTQFGMSEKIGPVSLDDDQEIFVGSSYGRSSNYSGKTAAVIDEEIKRISEECYERAVQVLRENREKLDLLVEALLQHETLSRKEFVALMDTGVLPEITEEGKPRADKVIFQQSAPAESDGKVNGIRVGTADTENQA